MDELQGSFSPPPCPTTVTVRRNPPRRARATPYTTAAKPPAASFASANTHVVPSFPIEEILSIEIPQPEPKSTESLKIFLRIKPLKSFNKVTTAKSRPRNVWPQIHSKKNQDNAKKTKKREEACIALNDSYSVTLTPPQALQELKRSKTEVYEGFSHVFPADCSQNAVYEKMVQPLMEDFMKGKSGMLAALGPSGSGKTHTVFGTPKDPGIVPLTLRQIFRKTDESCSPTSVRSFYLSIFEICSERGKGEKAYDLLGDGSSELFVQQSAIRGLKEVPIKDLEEAESLIGLTMLKRATATTNSNSQSSRSQCIINIRAAYNAGSNETKMQSTDAMLTIVDLAGAEREKRTGNQGERLVESNFINNTSMVFGQCLRSLLEYQKNRKKGFQKHHQNSLLTRYLRDYLEGKKRMALILTVKAGEEDYLDTSYLLKQASPYMKIKFDNIEELCNKRPLKTVARVEKNKKIKLNAPKTSKIEEIVVGVRNQNSQEVIKKGKKADPTDKPSPRLEHVSHDKYEREHIIMRNFAKVIWDVLKQYNEKLKVAESDIHGLKESLRGEQLKSHRLETELINLKSSCLFSKSNTAEPFITEAKAHVHSKELSEADTSLANEMSNVDDDPRNLIDTRREASAEGCESPVVIDNVVHLIDTRGEVSAEGCEYPVAIDNVFHGVGNEESSSAKHGDPKPSPEQVIPAAEAHVHSKELSEVDTSLANERTIVDDLRNLIGTIKELSAEGCESPVAIDNVVYDVENEEISSAKHGDPKPSPKRVVPEAEAHVHSKELSKVDTSLANKRNVDDDDDPWNLVEAREVSAEECKSPVPIENEIRGAENEEPSSVKQGDPTSLPEQVVPEAEAHVYSKELFEVDTSLANERNIDEDCRNLIDTIREVSAEGCESPVASKNVVHSAGNEEISSAAKHRDPTPSPEQVGECFNKLSNFQTESAIARRFPDSEKQKRNRRLLPAPSPRSLTDGINGLDIKDNQIETSQVKLARTRVQKKEESTQGCETDVPACEAEPASSKKEGNRQKPRRRLQPASSVLLTREINTLDIEDDITEPKGTRGGKKATMAQPRSQGSTTLLRLLTNNLHL